MANAKDPGGKEGGRPELEQGRLQRDVQKTCCHPSLEAKDFSGEIVIRVGNRNSKETATLMEICRMPHLARFYCGRDKAGKTYVFHDSDIIEIKPKQA